MSLPPAIRQNPPLQRKNETSRACQVVVVKVKQTNKHAPISIKSLLYSFFLIRSGGRGDRSLAQDSLSDEPFRVRDMQQRIPERPESAAPPPGSQPAVEAAAEVKQGGAKESVRVPRAHVRAPRPFQSVGGLDGD